MTGSSFSFFNADVLTPAGVARDPLHIEKGGVASAPQTLAFDLDRFLVLPGIIDLHRDGFECYLASRCGAVKNVQLGFSAIQSELAAHGTTTACLTQFTARKEVCAALNSLKIFCRAYIFLTNKLVNIIGTAAF